MVKRKLVKQPSGVYTITIPKPIVEAYKLQGSEFQIFVENGTIVLRKVE